MGSARLLAFVCLTFCGDWSSAAGPRVIFVDAAAEGAGDGASWTDAFANLPYALALSEPGNQIWVAEGTYRASSNRADTFQLKEGVEVFGGFAGNEIPANFLLSQRDLALHETLLDGDIGLAGPTDNVFHVVTAANVTRAAILDGFTIANGNASGLTLMQQDVGGGLYIVNASPTIRHCLIRDIQAGSRGGAVHIAGGSPYFAYCRFVGNRTTVTQAANNIGGAVYFAGTATSMAAPAFVNCLFVGNRAGVGNGGSGGAIYGGEHATATLVSCTLLHNRADTLTGGVFGSATIANSILYGNQDHNGFEVTAQLRGAVVASHCLVQGGWPGEGNVNADPLFRDPRGADGIAGTIDDDARLLAGSPCIDAGNNFAWPTDTEPKDMDGAARFMNDPAATDSGVPPGAALIDLGAYEKQSVCAASADCDDVLFCNGEETCANGLCQPESAPKCADTVPCTRDFCAEADRNCVHAADDSLCDNGLFCDGVEACDGLLGCLPGTAPNCDDAIVCTIDFCGEQVGQCIQTADHAACDDGVFCNGTELCDLVIGCVAAVISACDDGIGCTIDSCDENNQLCQHTPEHASCDDGFFCNGAELCGASGCTAGLPPCESENFCEEKLNQCAAPPTNCISDIDCDDANLCTDNHCVAGVCEEDFNGLPCDDGNACTTNDTCRSGSCTGEAIANCGAPPIDPGPGGTGPPTVDPPDEVEPPGIDEAPETDPEDPEESENEPQPEPPAGSPSGPCQHGEPCDDEPAQSQDSDADGVLDAEDLCPSTPAEQRTDVSGCGTDEPTPGRGTWVIEDARRCGACGAMGSIGVFIMVCVPGTVLVLGRPRGRKFIRLKCSASDHAACRRAPK